MYQGTMPCMKCANVLNIWNREYVGDGLVCIDCVERGRFISNTSERLFAIADRLQTLSPDDQVEEAKETGLNYNPWGIMYDTGLRDRAILDPFYNYFEDWMHTLVAGGQANSHTGLVLHLLRAANIPIKLVQSYVMTFNLPQKHGKMQLEWLSPARLSSTDHTSFTAFAATMLTIVPLI